MTTYQTAEIAEIIGIHPNTVRLYETLKLISKPERLQNGYRVFTDLHLEQCRLVRIAYQVEVLQNGLRKKITAIIKTCATGDFDSAANLTDEYLHQTERERANAEEAVEIVKQLLSFPNLTNARYLKLKEVSKVVGVFGKLDADDGFNLKYRNDGRRRG